VSDRVEWWVPVGLGAVGAVFTVGLFVDLVRRPRPE
jgi:hypothetical protein